MRRAAFAGSVVVRDRRRMNEILPFPFVRSEGNAWTENFHERKTRMADGFNENARRLVWLAREGAGDEVGSRCERDHQWTEGAQTSAAGGEGGIEVRLRGRRGLALGHAIDAVVHDDIGHVDVAPAGMEEMVAADGIAVAVAARHHDRQVRPRHFQSGGERQRTAVHAMEAVAIGIGRNARRAADTGHDDDIFRRQDRVRQKPG